MDTNGIRYVRLGYLALNVTDVARSKEYYERVLGLMPAGADGGYHFFRCSDRHHDIALYESDVAGLKRIGWQMESGAAIESLRAHFRDIGIETAAISDEDCATMRIDGGFRATEPTMGVAMEFYTRMEAAGTPFVPTHTKIVRLGHVVLGTPDVAASERFFAEHMNFRTSDRIGPVVVHMRCYPNPLHHSLGLGASPEPMLHHINFMVSDIDDIGRANNRMKRNDVQIVFGPGRHPQSDSVFFYFLDPDGITLEYSFGMEEFPETGYREARQFELIPENVDTWGGAPHPRFAKVGAIEQAAG